MRRFFALLLGLLASGPASAATLPFEAELVLKIGNNGFHSIGTVGSGVAIVNGSGGLGPLTSLALPAGFVATPPVVVPVTDPAVVPIGGFRLQPGNGPGSFAIGGGGQLGGAMPLSGVLRVCLFGSCPAAIANLTVPLTPVGAGGSATAQGDVLATVVGAPWTTGTAMAAGLGTSTFTGYAQGPASAPNSTARAGGSLLLVTPIAIHTSVSFEGPVPGFAFLTLHFVPEPATAFLLASGVALLAGFGRSRRRA